MFTNLISHTIFTYFFARNSVLLFARFYVLHYLLHENSLEKSKAFGLDLKIASCLRLA